MDERDAYIGLNMMEKIGPVGVRSLVRELGSAAAIFSAPVSDMQRAAGIGTDTARRIAEQRGTIDVEGEKARAQRDGIRLVTAIDAEYPELLREIHDPPLALYVRGTLDVRDRHAVAIVGSRSTTMYGRDVAKRFAGQLVRSGMTVVSGLAEGIDAVAHEAALASGGRTLAVTGSGPDCLYPACHRALADRIAEKGAVMTEFPFGKKPDKTTFPMRNRIVSGLSMGTLVVEASARSGALITARQALEQGREVFAVPGRIDSNASMGTNELIRQGAQLVMGVEHVMAAFDMLLPVAVTTRAPARPVPTMSDDETRLMELLVEGPKPVDGLIRESDLGAAAVNAALIMLEMKKQVRMLPGRVVERIHV